MDFCQDIIREILQYYSSIEEYINFALISSNWKKIVQEKMYKNKVWDIVFPNIKPLKKNPMPEMSLGDLELNPYKIERWLSTLGVRKLSKKNTSKYKSIPLFRKNWDDKNKIRPFSDEWNTYFKSIRRRLYKKLPIIYFLDTDRDYTQGVRWYSGGELFLVNFMMSDIEDPLQMKKLKNSKWICWNLDNQLEGYDFDIEAWRDIEKLYSFATGLPPRKVPNFPEYVLDDITSQNANLLKKIRKYQYV